MPAAALEHVTDDKLNQSPCIKVETREEKVNKDKHYQPCFALAWALTPMTVPT